MKLIDADKLKAEIERRRLQNRHIDTDGYEQELFEIIDSLQQEQEQKEEPDSEEFTEEFDKYFLPRNHEQKGRWGFADIFNLARHFAEWQKEQMLKEAVEGYVGMHLTDKGTKVTVNSGYLPEEMGIRSDSKVRIIIVKEEEE